MQSATLYLKMACAVAFCVVGFDLADLVGFDDVLVEVGAEFVGALLCLKSTSTMPKRLL
jgi:hypothetical protein